MYVDSSSIRFDSVAARKWLRPNGTAPQPSCQSPHRGIPLALSTIGMILPIRSSLVLSMLTFVSVSSSAAHKSLICRLTAFAPSKPSPWGIKSRDTRCLVGGNTCAYAPKLHVLESAISWRYVGSGQGRRYSSHHRSHALALKSSSGTGEATADTSSLSPTECDDTKQPQSERTVTILDQGPSYLVASKPPSVVCHHSGWTGSRSKAKRGEEPEIPMLQRVRDGISSIAAADNGGSRSKTKRVNVIHRLDRGASGCLLFAYAEDSGDSTDDRDDDEEEAFGKRSSTAILQEALASPNATKTYLALVRGEGILRGDDLKTKGWFKVDRPIKDEKGRLNNATTYFRFVAGQPYDEDNDIPRASLVLARPETGRWHQVRRHLNGLSHPILGDTSHGSSKTNREWKERRNMPGERTCLHLARMQIPPNEAAPEGIDVCCALEDDMIKMMEVHMPKVLEEAEPILAEEGISIRPNPANDKVKTYTYKSPKIDTERRKAVTKLNEQKVNILSQGAYHVVVEKPSSVVCHHSSWTGKRSEARRLYEPTPMLQRVRDAMGRKVNLIHRLDRGTSGCLIFSFADKEESVRATTALMEAMGRSEASKTYLALVRGDGKLNGEDLISRGWFTVDAAVKDENGNFIETASTDLRFVAAASNLGGEDTAGSSACLVLARPKTGRWHQVRQHLANAIGHPILGDSTHGLSRTNRIWREQRGMLKERVCLHLAHVTLPPTEFTPQEIEASCPIPRDMMNMMERHIPSLLGDAKSVLEEEDCLLPPTAVS